MTPDFALLALAVAGLLLALTLSAEALRARVPPGRRVPGVEAFAARVRSWWAMAILLALALLLGRAGVVLLFALAAFAALREVAEDMAIAGRSLPSPRSIEDLRADRDVQAALSAGSALVAVPLAVETAAE